MFWQDVLKVPTPVLDCIRSGYKLPLITVPPVHLQENQQTVFECQKFVDEAIVDLQKVAAAPHACSPLSVMCIGEGKKCLVINLRYVDCF